MSDIAAVSASLAGSPVALASSPSQNQLQEAVSTQVLAETLDFQKTMAAELLRAMGIGQQIDLEV